MKQQQIKKRAVSNLKLNISSVRCWKCKKEMEVICNHCNANHGVIFNDEIDTISQVGAILRDLHNFREIFISAGGNNIPKLDLCVSIVESLSKSKVECNPKMETIVSKGKNYTIKTVTMTLKDGRAD